MAKQILQDSFEKVFELGQSTAKQTGQAIKQTFSPLKLLEQITGSAQKNQNDQGMEKLEKARKKQTNHSPLDLKRLQESYQDQDSQKINNLKRKLFNLVKKEEKQAIEEHEQKEERRKRKIAQEEEEKKKKEEERKKQESQLEEPQGKQRRSIFSPKRKAQKKTAEIKPSIGKH